MQSGVENPEKNPRQIQLETRPVQNRDRRYQLVEKAGLGAKGSSQSTKFRPVQNESSALWGDRGKQVVADRDRPATKLQQSNCRQRRSSRSLRRFATVRLEQPAKPRLASDIGEFRQGFLLPRGPPRLFGIDAGT